MIDDGSVRDYHGTEAVIGEVRCTLTERADWVTEEFLPHQNGVEECDAGYGFGAILIGVTADLVSIEAAFYGVAAAMFLSGGVALVWMRETHPARGNHGAPGEAVHESVRR